MDLKERGARLREIREGRGLSVRDLEEISGVHRNTTSGIETGKHKPRPSTLQKLAEALEVDVEDITGGLPKGEAPLFSDLPPRGPHERRVDYLTAPTDLVEGVEAWLRGELEGGAGLEAVERAAWFHREFLEHAAEKIGLTRNTAGLPVEEARAMERLATALDDLRSTVDEGYTTAIKALMGKKAEVKPIGNGGQEHADEETEGTEEIARSA